jgi:hypothetical protein
MKKILLVATALLLLASQTSCQSCRLWPSPNDPAMKRVYAAPSAACGPGCNSCGGTEAEPSLQVGVPGYTPVLGQ